MVIQGGNAYEGPSFSLANRAGRFFWGLLGWPLFRITPRPFHAVRRWLLICWGARIGKGSHIYPGARIWAPWNLICGKSVGIADGAIIYNMDRIEIGDYSVISQGAHLCGGTHDYNSPGFQLIAKPIIIGRRVWVCAEAFVQAGVSIPTGAVIGARAVVSKSPEKSWTVYAGIPCKAVGERNVVDE